MKTAFKSVSSYIYGTILVLLGLVPFVIAIIAYVSPSIDWTFEFYPFVDLGVVALYILVGFIASDVYIIVKKNKTKSWDVPLDEQSATILWKIRVPFIFACVVLGVLALVLEAIRIIGGNYPFI
jgi:hypothetical protein